MDDDLVQLLLLPQPNVQYVQDEGLDEVLSQLQLSVDDDLGVQDEDILVPLTCIVKKMNGDLQQPQHGDSMHYDVQYGDL